MTSGATAAQLGGRKMFLVDLRGASLLLNEARYRTVERAFGVKRDQVNLTTLIVLLLIAESARRRAERYRPSRRPTLADYAIGAGALRESIYGVAGPASRDTQLTGTLIVAAIFVGLMREPMSRGVHGMKSSSRKAHQAFLGRYGHLVSRNGRPDQRSNGGVSRSVATSSSTSSIE